MSKVVFLYNNGKRKSMLPRYADVLTKLKKGRIEGETVAEPEIIQQNAIELSAMLKPELLALAQELGLDAKPAMAKNDILKLLEENI